MAAQMFLPAQPTENLVPGGGVAPSWLLDVQAIYMEPAVADYKRGQAILAKFPNAERIEVESHWKIPGLFGFGGNVADWNKIKRNVLVLGVKKSLRAEPNTRSSDFIAPSHANGCAMSCSYCYVPRQKGYANPITTFVNIEQISAYLTRHATKLGLKDQPSQIDAKYWVYDIGCNSDCSADALICDNTRDLVTLFRDLPTAKASFATKYVNRALLNYDPQGKTRIRLSLMPQRIAKVVDVRTSSIAERVASINEFHAAGYEVHLNFSPVIHYEGWQADYRELFDELAQVLRPEVKAQLGAEIIFLTHNEKLHEINLGWHPKGEELLWKPELQETKYSQMGGRNIRYKRGVQGGFGAGVFGIAEGAFAGVHDSVRVLVRAACLRITPRGFEKNGPSASLIILNWLLQKERRQNAILNQSDYFPSGYEPARWPPSPPRFFKAKADLTKMVSNNRGNLRLQPDEP